MVMHLILLMFSPLASLLLAIRFYKSAVSQFFMVVFAVYFGYHCGFVYDMMSHYTDMMNLYHNRDVSEILADPAIFFIGKDLYHIAFKLVLSRFTTSTQVFGAVASGLYCCAFLFFFRQLKRFYFHKLSQLSGIALLCVVSVVEFYWYQGLRFWIGVFIFMGFYMRYVNTGGIKYLLYSCTCVAFHLALMILPVAAVINWALKFCPHVFRWVLVVLSLFVRSLNVDFVPLMLKYMPWTGVWGVSVTDKRIRHNVLEAMDRLRSSNFIYTHRLDFMIGVGTLVLLLFVKARANVGKQYMTLFWMFVTMFTISNFGYGDATFFNRYYKVATLFLYIYIFVVTVQCNPQIRHDRLVLMVLLLGVGSFALLTPMVELREYVFHIQLFFGNIFQSWDGNQLDMQYHWNHMRR